MYSSDYMPSRSGRFRFFFALSAIAYSTYSNVEEAEAALVSPAVGE